jgi:hypothetical protein
MMRFLLIVVGTLRVPSSFVEAGLPIEPLSEIASLICGGRHTGPTYRSVPACYYRPPLQPPGGEAPR